MENSAQFIEIDYHYTMNKQVTDISESLQVMAEEMQQKHKTIESKHSEICQLNRNTDKFNSELRKRNKRIEELECKLAKYESHDKNSGKSSIPPSKENMKSEVICRTKSLRKSNWQKARWATGTHE